MCARWYRNEVFVWNIEIAFNFVRSGTVAVLMPGERTANSTLRLLLKITEQEFPVCNIGKASRRGQLLQKCKVII